MGNKKTDLQTIEQSPVMVKGEEASFLISQAINKNVPVETMERLLAMRRELRAEKAKEEYDLAMAQFQADCPTIQKTKKVYEKDKRSVRYSYAPLDSIVSQIKELLRDNGFSYAITTKQENNMLEVTCKVNHKLGHSEETTFAVPIGSEGYMSDVQKYGARLTFAKRYAFCNAFGILTGDEDTDATEEQTPITPRQMATAIENNEKPQYSGLASEKQVNFIHGLLKNKHYNEASLLKKYEISSLSELTKDQASDAIERLNTLPVYKNKAVEEKTEEQDKEGEQLAEEVAQGLEKEGVA